jgi:UPF0755 protein
MKTLGCIVIALCTLFLATLWWTEYEFNAPGDLTEPVTLVFPLGTGFETIADMMAEKGIIRHPNLFKVQVFLRGKSSRFKAGEYAFPPHVSPASAAHMIASGKAVIRHLTIPEGLMVSEIIEIVSKVPVLRGEITLDIKEGELLPETYFFSYGDKRNDMLLRMKRAMEEAVKEAWAGRAEGLPITTPEEAVILASIVEKETWLAAERPNVASVYINRLKKNMLLQADPTTVYALTQGKQKLDRPLTLSDLKLESPYNTYSVKGLPPGPIANPGKASLMAALHPANTDYLYFVATGKGGHNFARTGAEHAANVKLYREAQKQQSAPLQAAP